MKLLQMIDRIDTQKNHERKSTAEVAAALLESDPSIDSFFPGFLKSKAFTRIAETCSFLEVQRCVGAMGWLKTGWQKIPQIAHNQRAHRQNIKSSQELRTQAYKLLREAARLEGLIDEDFFLPDRGSECKQKPSPPVTGGNLNERWDSLSNYQKDWLTHTFNKSTPESATGFEATYNRFFSELGGATNKDGAIKGSAVRFLDQYIPARIKAGKGKRHSTIAQLLKFTGIDVSPQYVRSTLNRS